MANVLLPLNTSDQAKSQLKVALNSTGDCLVFALNNLLKDGECSKPNS